MTQPSSKRRMIENQAYFRSLNQKVQKGIDAVNKIAEQDGQEPIQIDPDTPLFFLCECADENCTERVKISPSAYNAVHQDPKSFVICHDHQVDRIETVISEEQEYMVVRKYDMPPETATTLHPTSVDNSSQ